MITVFYAYKNKEQSLPMLCHVLEKYYGVTEAESKIKKDGNKKPFLQDNSVYFNLSHTDGLIMIAVSTSGQVGIDCENITINRNYEKIAEKYFSIDERKQIKSLTHFYILWTKKESAIKYAGQTLAKCLKDTSFKGFCPIGFDFYEGAETQSFKLDDYVYSVTSKDKIKDTIFII